MSVSLTADAVVARRKTVTRRLGWRFAKLGDRITLCRKVMGRKPGEPLVRLADVEIVSVRIERLDSIDLADVIREGFIGWSPDLFVEHFCRKMNVGPDAAVTRIEWRYLDG